MSVQCGVFSRSVCGGCVMCAQDQRHEVELRINRHHRGEYEGRPQDREGQFWNRLEGPYRRPDSTDVCFYRNTFNRTDWRTLVQTSDARHANVAPLGDSFMVGHTRQYYDPVTHIALGVKDITEPLTDENDTPDWLFVRMRNMIDEFKDMNDGEKMMMKLWNTHIMNYGFPVSVGQLETILRVFLQPGAFGRLIIKHNLFYNFQVHVYTMFTLGWLSSQSVSNVLDVLLQLKNFARSERSRRDLEPLLVTKQQEESVLLKRLQSLPSLPSVRSRGGGPGLTVTPVNLATYTTSTLSTEQLQQPTTSRGSAPGHYPGPGFRTAADRQTSAGSSRGVKRAADSSGDESDDCGTMLTTKLRRPTIKQY